MIAGDISEAVASRYVADEFWRMPRLDEVSVEEMFAECSARGVTSVLPTRDGELLFWAAAADLFRSRGVHVIVSSEECVRRCLDKLAFASFGIANDLSTIPASQRIEDVGGPRYVVKERVGAGSRGIGLDLDREAALAHAQRLSAPLFQPFMPGHEVSIDAWSDANCRVKGLVLRRREVVVSGESVITATFRDRRLEDQARRMLESLGLRGPSVLQAIVGDDGELHVIECNCRFGGASTAGIAAGLDPLYWSLLEASGGDLEALPFDRIPGEVRQVRVSEDLHFHDNCL